MKFCICHNEPMRWCNDARKKSGGYWRCIIKRRLKDQAAHHRNRDGRLERRRAQQLERWHRADGGYIQARRRELAKQRADIIARLAELEQEAVTSC